MNPISRGTALAVTAALFFGVTTPLVKASSQGAGPFATAALLYAGAALGSGLPRHRGDEPSLGAPQLRRLAVVALLGAFLAPAALAWGLQRSGALGGSLLLNLEAPLTVLLALLFYREPVGRRVAVALALMFAGGALLIARGGDTPASALGLVAVAGASLAWAMDNTLTRPLADFDPRAVVFVKALFGATLSLAVASLARERWPAPRGTAVLLAAGAAGFGLSLRLYLAAQRALGAARTGSIFAVAPFVGAAIAFASGDRQDGSLVAAAGALFALAVYLHATEDHGHPHVHEPLAHEHAHRHDDGHHTHVHSPPFTGEHSHAHEHEPIEHQHAHGADVHHRHSH